MYWQLAWYVFYLNCLIAASAATFSLVRVERLRTYTAAFLVAIGCILGGWPVAVIATPDWSPLTMLAAYLPFLALGIWSGAVARRRSSSPPRRA